jgi:hypothetical protein
MTQHRQETNQRPPDIPQEQWRNNIGGPAFPSFESHLGYGQMLAVGGMTLRDYFAAKALQAMLSDPVWRSNNDSGLIAHFAYKMADAMLKARQA